ncbi:MAG: PQQ-binding-like beta-propeller repeat protein [Pacificimonas sp.]|nr:PQQ-binding-like beta-propeller repeat protein [Pacificimonas sp.]
MIRRQWLCTGAAAAALAIGFVSSDLSASDDNPMAAQEKARLAKAEAAAEAGFASHGAMVWDQACAACHEVPEMRLLTRAQMQAMSPVQLRFTMTDGKMKPQSAHLDDMDIEALVDFLAPGGEAGFAVSETEYCADRSIDLATVHVGGFGIDRANSRRAQQTTVTRANVANAEVAWVFGMPSTSEMRSVPVVTGDTIFAAVQAGHVFALDKDTGCVKWHRDLAAPVRSALSLVTVRGAPALAMQDAGSQVHVLDPATGETLWDAFGGLSTMSMGTGGLNQLGDKIIVPVSSTDVGAAMDPNHECCRGHGGVVALDADTGERRWEWHATEEATPQGVSSVGTQLWGPSGVPVWATPAVDEKRNRVYIGTGENTSLPTTKTSDALIALDGDTGEAIWIYQATEHDAFNMACSYFGESGPNCPRNPPGPDLDFGGSVTLATMSDGRDVLVAGQKSGDVHAVDVESGELLWKQKVGRGSALGGIHWGISVADGRVYAPNADPPFPIPGFDPTPGLFTLALDTGEPIWEHRVERGCDNPPNPFGPPGDSPWPDCSAQFALSAAPTSTAELVFAGALDGKLRAFDAANGEVLWETETARAFDSVNSVAAHGGAIDNSGPLVAGDMIFVPSGYSLFRQMPGNALIAYRVPAE